MSGLIALPEGLPTTSKYAEKGVAVVASSGFLGYVSLGTGTSKAVQEGKLGIGEFGLYQNQQVVSLGKQFTGIFYCWRPLAMDFSGEGRFYNPDSEGFLDIKERSGEEDSGCSYGAEFLVWLPEQKVFVHYFLGSISGRQEAGVILGHMKAGPCVILQGSAPRYSKKRNKTYQVPTTTVTTVEVEQPDMELLKSTWTSFANPAEKEVATEEASDR